VNSLAKKQNAYSFNELSDEAKENARNRWREFENEGFDAECVIDDAEQVANIIGIEFETRSVPLMNGKTREKPKVWYSGFCSQGDGASFEGWYSYKKGSKKAIRDYAPQDTELHRITDALQAIQKRNFYSLAASISQSGFYYHSHTMSVEVEDNRDRWRDVSSDDHDDITELMRDFADWIYKQLESEYEWRMSDECIGENILANECEFTESGELA
jgi:hypothetical protein